MKVTHGLPRETHPWMHAHAHTHTRTRRAQPCAQVRAGRPGAAGRLLPRSGPPSGAPGAGPRVPGEGRLPLSWLVGRWEEGAPAPLGHSREACLGRASQAGALCLGFSLRDMSLRGSCSLTIRTARPPDSSVHWRGRRAGVSRGCSLTSNLKLSCRLVTPGRWRCLMWPF